ncbi:cell division protein ZapA [Sphingomonas sp.]|jgi:cell division protein ZapA|uniref:cell division protein ZapA n=1 Tax=Sphingomonas sp. TaxID=28214 RepID=UPI002E3603A6|nr:cell division protein ZapA [Sphingomonas sp.]HEX4694068.1 cell division protein ZapA [Sphingomonas sp.]
MAEVTLTIGDRRHNVTCRDGEEAQLRRLGDMLDQRWSAANRASGGLNAERTMLLVALMLADSLDNAENRPASDGGPSPVFLTRIAERLEGIASALEKPVADA